MSYIVAKTIQGKEYLYSKINCYAVSSAKKDIICQLLNNVKYQLTGLEKWKVYDIGLIDMEYTNARFEKLYMYKGKVFKGSCK